VVGIQNKRNEGEEQADGGYSCLPGMGGNFQEFELHLFLLLLWFFPVVTMATVICPGTRVCVI
jgi:hypothetical protein